MENNTNNSFQYTYSAREQEELRKIRDKYAEKAPEEDALARLRRLDARVTQRAQAISLCLGILGTLILGLGMSLILSELGAALGTLALPLGVLIGIIGGVLAGVAYPAYSLALQKERKKVAPEILRLTDMLLK